MITVQGFEKRKRAFIGFNFSPYQSFIKSLKGDSLYMKPIELTRFIAEHFTREEIAQLCQSLDIDDEEIAGDVLSAKARHLVKHCQNHGDYEKLEAEVVRLRRNVINPPKLGGLNENTKKRIFVGLTIIIGIVAVGLIFNLLFNPNGFGFSPFVTPTTSPPTIGLTFMAPSQPGISTSPSSASVSSTHATETAIPQITPVIPTSSPKPDAVAQPTLTISALPSSTDAPPNIEATDTQQPPPVITSTYTPIPAPTSVCDQLDGPESKLECQALIAIFQSTNGPSWQRSGAWTQTNSPCSWGDETIQNSVTCNNDGRVTDLKLGNNNLDGYLPKDICKLEMLQTLNIISNPKLIGLLPDCMFDSLKMPKLHAINYAGSCITEPNTDEFRNWLKINIARERDRMDEAYRNKPCN
jgi:Effector-associated domain 7